MLTALNRYWDYLRIERQMSPHTLTNYQHQLDAIIKILVLVTIFVVTESMMLSLSSAAVNSR